MLLAIRVISLQFLFNPHHFVKNFPELYQNNEQHEKQNYQDRA